MKGKDLVYRDHSGQDQQEDQSFPSTADIAGTIQDYSAPLLKDTREDTPASRNDMNSWQHVLRKYVLLPLTKGHSLIRTIVWHIGCPY